MKEEEEDLSIDNFKKQRQRHNNNEVTITLVSKDNFLLFTPMQRRFDQNLFNLITLV
jgi:hypothetical protein